jgi:L-alanine-DL-glutamate epimerase-like enolase superfamily enzyme
MFRIAEIDAFAVAVPLKTPIKMAGIVIDTCDNLIVKITDGDGNVGWGEACSAPTMTGDMVEGMVAAANFMAARLKGAEIEDAAQLRDLIEPLMYGNHGSKSAIDGALYDLIGQHLGKPMYEILGGKAREQAPSYWMVAGGPDEMQIAGLRRDEGYISFKVKVGVNAPEVDLERAGTARSVVGDGVCVSADANQGFSPKDALTFARGAGDAGLDFFEQPVMGHDIAAMRACAEACAVPIGADEGLHSIADIQRHHDEGAAAGGSLKLIKLGGAGEVMDAGRLMQSLSMKVNIAGKIADTSIGSAVIAHIAVALPTLAWDASVTNQYLADDVVADPIAIVDGHIVTPDGPGLGIAVDEAKLQKYRRAI